MTTALTRDSILGTDDIIVERVPVPLWGGDVFVRSLTAAERDDFESTLMVTKTTRNKRGKNVKDRDLNMKNARAKLVQLTVCKSDTDKSQMFTTDDVISLGKKSGASLDLIYDVAARLAGITDNDLDEIEKKS